MADLTKGRRILALVDAGSVPTALSEHLDSMHLCGDLGSLRRSAQFGDWAVVVVDGGLGDVAGAVKAVAPLPVIAVGDGGDAAWYAAGVIDVIPSQAAELAAAKLQAFARLHARGVEIQERSQDERRRRYDEIRKLQTLLYVCSRDIREPLRGIQSFSDLLSQRYADTLGDEGRDWLRRVIRAVERVRALLDDIHEVSKAIKLVPTEARTPAADLVDSALAELADRIDETGAEVEVIGPLPELPLSARWGSRALQNLLSNALKFTQDDHTPNVEIAAFRSDDEDLVGIVVRDRGPGVEFDQRERIFDLFARSAPRHVPGTGAGLAIVREVAEAHAGRAYVMERDGGGSEFVLAFPRPPEGAP